MNKNASNPLSEEIKRHRLARSLTVNELATKSGVSASHLSRIERGERFPSPSILQKVAQPLGFEEIELLTLARYLSQQPTMNEEENLSYVRERLDPYVAKVLTEEPVTIQRSVVVILNILKSFAKSICS